MAKGKNGKPRASAFARSAAKSEPSDDMGEEFDYGTWHVTYSGCVESENGAFCVKLAGAGKDKKIGDRIQWFSTKGKAVHVSGPRLKKLAMLLSGCEDTDEYNAFDPEGLFLDALLNADLDAAADLLVEGERAKNTKAARALLATVVRIKVTKGSEKDDGGHFHNGEFSAVKDDGDDAEESDDEDEDDEPESERPAKRGKGKAKDDEDADEDAEDEDDAPESEPESERRPAKKKARRK